MPRCLTQTLLLFCLLASGLPGRAQHLSWRNYSINEGLPSNDVFHLTQGRDGRLWVAGQQGICAFNGYEFHRPVDTSVAAGSPAFRPLADEQGRIWFFRLPLSFWFVENDTVRPWPHNPALAAWQNHFGYSSEYALDAEGNFWLATDGRGYRIVGADGREKPAPQLPDGSWCFTEINGRVLEATGRPAARGAPAVQTPDVYCLKGGERVGLGRFPLVDQGKGVPLRVWRLRNGDFLLCRLQNFYLVRDKQLVWYGRKDTYVEDVWEADDGAILMASLAEGATGLLRYPSRRHFERDVFENLLPGRELTSVLRDHEGGWWAATRDAGLFYCKNPRLDIYDRSCGLPADHVQRLTTDGSTVYAGFRPFDICAIPAAGGPPRSLPRPPGNSHKELTALRFDTLTGRLWCGADLCFWQNGRWTFSKKTPGLTDRPEESLSAQNIAADPNGQWWWVDYRYYFAAVDRRSGQVVQSVESAERLFSVTADGDGSLWITTLGGLRRWRAGQFQPLPFQHAALRFPARGVNLLPDRAGGGQVIRLRGGGLLICGANGRCVHLTTVEGLYSDVFSDLVVTPDGVIYACSNAGLNRLRYRAADGSWQVEGITVKHGLPSNQVNDVLLLGDELWVATDRGIARFREPPSPTSMPPPRLEYFRVNNRDTVFVGHIRLAHDQNNLLLRFFALHFRSGGHIPYRYRLLPNDTGFVYTQQREVSFAQLPPGRYNFEVQAQDEDGQWSESAHFRFEVCPPWWATGWFRLLAFAAFCALVGWFFQNRLRTLRREAAEREKIRDLEAAALRAQMNPHFIFNCLQAIQAFIARNDRDAAAGYLARFAKLVRLALHSSVDGRHTLAEEIAMLDHYLHLEQLRFQGKFAFELRVETGLDPEEITLPPLLVQPFVENALIHGLAGRQSAGRLEVVFARNDGRLQVTVTDNGDGVAESNTTGRIPGHHKSVGLLLTQKRLDLLGGSGFVRETLRDADGKPAGTRIRLDIGSGG